MTATVFPFQNRQTDQQFLDSQLRFAALSVQDPAYMAALERRIAEVEHVGASFVLPIGTFVAKIPWGSHRVWMQLTVSDVTLNAGGRSVQALFDHVFGEKMGISEFLTGAQCQAAELAPLETPYSALRERWQSNPAYLAAMPEYRRMDPVAAMRVLEFLDRNRISDDDTVGIRRAFNHALEMREILRRIRGVLFRTPDDPSIPPLDE